MRLLLRWKILLFTVPPLVTLTVGALWTVNRNIAAQVHQQIRDDLRRASAVFENMLHARTTELAVTGGVIVRDPKFFSVLSLPVSPRDPQFRATVAGVARDFNQITQTDLFEITDSGGRLLASVGRSSSSEAARSALVVHALQGRPAQGLLAERDAHYQVVVTPVIADGRVVGALLLGAAVGTPLAEQLRDLTHSEVTFLSGGRATGTTLSRPEDRDAAVLAAAQHEQRTARGALENAVTEVLAPGQTWITLVSPIPSAGLGARQYYVMQRSLDAETGFLREIRNHLVEFGLIAVALALIAGLVIAQGIAAPVRQMVRAAEEMERGNYDYPLEVNSNDEIGYLATRFEDMRSQQRSVVETLQETARVRREFISVASHELRTPISVIRGYQELMRAETMGPISEHQVKALDAIGRSVETLGRIAEDATRMSQIETDKLTLELNECDLREVIETGVREAQESGRGRAVDVKVSIDGDSIAIQADAPRLAHALANLVRNGIRFTPDGGNVTVRGWRDDALACVEVRDTGVGIPAGRLRHLLERQLPVRDSMNHHSSHALEFNSAGLGLGLSIARGIIEAHGGTIRAESQEGRGTAFVLAFPVDGVVRLPAAA